MLHDVKIRRTRRYGKIAVNVVAPEDFVISADATSLRKARLIGDKQQKTRAELLEMGFDEAEGDGAGAGPSRTTAPRPRAATAPPSGLETSRMTTR